jgi:ferritin-like metal-binding protein YciE
MPELKELLIEQMQDLLSAENQLVSALPNMASAAKSPKLREAFEKHLEQTQMHVERLQRALELLGEDGEAKTCRGMAGLIQEGDEVIQEYGDGDEISSDLALAAAAQKVEHYEIAGYGTARTLAMQLDEREVARLLSHTLGEEERTDFLLTEICKPLLQQAREGELVGSSKR